MCEWDCVDFPTGQRLMRDESSGWRPRGRLAGWWFIQKKNAHKIKDVCVLSSICKYKHGHTQRYVSLHLCVYFLAYCMCVCPVARQLASGCFCLSSCREPVYAFIREMPQGVVDSINPMRRREFLIPHHAPSNSQSYQLAEAIWMAQFNMDASICGHMQMRFKWSHYFQVRTLRIERAPARTQGELHQRYRVNWYSGGSKSASFLLFKRLLARRILDFLTELHC